eukprot:Sro398_g134690.2  (178) ;mRNA; f:40461-41061
MDSYTFNVHGGVDLYVIAHAVSCGSEFEDKSLPEPEPEPKAPAGSPVAAPSALAPTAPEEFPEPKAGCETAFAYNDDGSATCFSEFGINRWGWSIGPIVADGVTHTYDIYAGAGQCNIGKGEKVGTLGFTFDGTTAEAIYQVAEGFGFDETHFYIGCSALPEDTYSLLLLDAAKYTS